MSVSCQRRPAVRGGGAGHWSAAFAACAAAAWLTAGCATICSRSRYEVSIESQPCGARVAVLDHSQRVIATGITPCKATFKAKRGYLRPAILDVRFERDGYWPARLPVMADADPWVLGDFVLPGSLVWFLAVDGATGAMWRLPEKLSVELQPSE
ncbi:MAG: hypothetical protein PHR35_04320 [Kiritimatiellae bacterium]|nr:hypothetical protein [Kiritimatiellia bacterium]